MTTLCCYIEGKRDVICVSEYSSSTIHDLKKSIYNEGYKFFNGCDPMDLTLIKVNVDLDTVKDKIMQSEYRPDVNDQPQPSTGKMIMSRLSEVWPKPRRGHLHVFVRCPPNAIAVDQGPPRLSPLSPSPPICWATRLRPRV